MGNSFVLEGRGLEFQQEGAIAILIHACINKHNYQIMQDDEGKNIKFDHWFVESIFGRARDYRSLLLFSELNRDRLSPLKGGLKRVPQRVGTCSPEVQGSFDVLFCWSLLSEVHQSRDLLCFTLPAGQYILAKSIFNKEQL